MPFRAKAPFLPIENFSTTTAPIFVSMPFRASTPFLHVSAISPDKYPLRYQCPLGLKLHFYIKPAETDSSLEYGINALSG